MFVMLTAETFRGVCRQLLIGIAGRGGGRGDGVNAHIVPKQKRPHDEGQRENGRINLFNFLLQFSVLKHRLQVVRREKSLFEFQLEYLHFKL